VIHLFAASTMATIKANQHVVFDNCRVEDTPNALVLVEGSAERVTLSNCVMVGGGDGLVFRPLKETRWADLSIQNNTFARITRDAINLDPTGAAFEAKSVAVRDNKFVQCKNIFTVAGDAPAPAIVKEGNLRDVASGEGNGGLGAKVGQVKLPN
jgi:hypothetical protein